MDAPFQRVFTYQEPNPDKPILKTDSKAMFLALYGMCFLPLYVESNGRKTKIAFYENDETKAIIQKIHLHIMGSQQELKMDYCRIIDGERLWGDFMSVQINYLPKSTS